MQGIVNNAEYQHYLEHTRHEFLHSIDIDFAEYASKGIHLVVARAELDYKYPLKSGDSFIVGLNLSRVSRLRFCFEQEIYNPTTQKLHLQAKIFATGINEKGKPFLPEKIINLLNLTQS